MTGYFVTGVSYFTQFSKIGVLFALAEFIKESGTK